MISAESEAKLAEFGRRLALAESEISALKANQGGPKKVTPLSAPAQETVVQISHPVERCPIALPNEEERGKLLGVVFNAYPTLRPWTPGSNYASQDEQDFVRQFSAAFTYVANHGRADEIDHKRSASYWADQASEWWRQRGSNSRVGGAAFLAACVAAGDISFQRSDHWGNTWAVALASYGGKPATDSWRHVLRGDLRRPTPGIHKPPSGDGFSVRPASAR